MVILETPRLALRHLEPSDLDALFLLYRDAETRRNFPDGTRTFEETKEELEWFQNGHPEFPRLGLWATVERGSGAVRRVHAILGAALICAALQACVYLPSTIEVYDPECQVVAKHMTLQEVQVAAIGGCQNQSCVAMILAVAATSAASVIVSGSIVIMGNIAYWLERQSTCRRAK